MTVFRQNFYHRIQIFFLLVGSALGNDCYNSNLPVWVEAKKDFKGCNWLAKVNNEQYGYGCQNDDVKTHCPLQCSSAGECDTCVDSEMTFQFINKNNIEMDLRCEDVREEKPHLCKDSKISKTCPYTCDACPSTSPTSFPTASSPPSMSPTQYCAPEYTKQECGWESKYLQYRAGASGKFYNQYCNFDIKQCPGGKPTPHGIFAIEGFVYILPAADAHFIIYPRHCNMDIEAICESLSANNYKMPSSSASDSPSESPIPSMSPSTSPSTIPSTTPSVAPSSMPSMGPSASMSPSLYCPPQYRKEKCSWEYEYIYYKGGAESTISYPYCNLEIMQCQGIDPGWATESQAITTTSQFRSDFEYNLPSVGAHFVIYPQHCSNMQVVEAICTTLGDMF